MIAPAGPPRKGHGPFTLEAARDAWHAVVMPIPGLELDRVRTQRPRSQWLVGGGCGFWMVAAFVLWAWFAFKYLAIAVYVGFVLGVRLIAALGATAGWGMAALVHRLRRD